MKEVSVLGVYFPPLFADIVVALILFAPLKWVLDRIGADRWIWHRPLADVALFICIVSAVTLAWPRVGPLS
jgi:hypothetical protein